MGDKVDENTQFIDKRDEKFIKLTSKSFFFEIFNKKKTKCDQIIPHTILFSNGQPSAWYFNSVKEKTPIILKKNTDKLHLYEIAKHFVGMSNLDDYKAENLIALNEYMQKTDTSTPVCVLKYIDGKFDIINAKELVKIFANGINLTRIMFIQSFVQNNSKAQETYYVEFRQEEITLQGNFKYFKKSSVVDNHNNSKRSFFKYLDESMNKKLQSCCQNMMMFFEKAYKVKIRKMVSKFLIDKTQKIFYLGSETIMIDIPQHSPYQSEQLELELREQPKGHGCNSFNEFIWLCKQYKRQKQDKASASSQLKLPKVVQDGDKQYSSKLYKQLRLEKCKGDFCEYIISEQNNYLMQLNTIQRGFLIFRKNLMSEYTKHFPNKQKNEMEAMQTSLPHEISNQLILKGRQKSDFVVDLFFKNRIFLKSSSFIDMMEDELKNHKFVKEKEYPFVLKNHQADNYENLYKNVKICKVCYTFYQLLQENFDKDLQKQIKSQKSQNSLNQTTTDTLSGIGMGAQDRLKRNQNLESKIIKASSLTKLNSFSKTNTTVDQSASDNSAFFKQRIDSNYSNQKIQGNSDQESSRVSSRSFQRNKLESIINNKLTDQNQLLELSDQKEQNKTDQKLPTNLNSNPDNSKFVIYNSSSKPPLIRKSASSNIKVRFQRQNSSKTNLIEHNNKTAVNLRGFSSNTNKNEPNIQKQDDFDSFIKVNDILQISENKSKNSTQNQYKDGIQKSQRNSAQQQNSSIENDKSTHDNDNDMNGRENDLLERVAIEKNQQKRGSVSSQNSRDSNNKEQKGNLREQNQIQKETDQYKRVKDLNSKSSTHFGGLKQHKQENIDPKKDIKYMNFLNYDKQNRLYRQQDNELQNLEKELKSLNKNITLNQIDLTEQNENEQIQLKDKGGEIAKWNEKRKQIIQKSKYESEARANLQIFAMSNQSKPKSNLLSQVSKFYQQSQTLQHLRKLPAFLLSTPLQPFGEELNIKKKDKLNLIDVIDLMNYPQSLSDTTFLDKIQYSIIDKFTAVPYLLFYPESKTIKSKFFNIVCLDFFDSFLEYRPIFNEIQTKFPDQSFLLFNIPGQAHTIFKEDGISYDADYCVKVLDQILFELEEQSLFDGNSQQIRCIGLGYGTYILQNFIIQSSRHLQIPQCCFFNSISKFDKQLKETVKQSLEVFEYTPNDMPDLSFSYYSNLCNMKQLNEGQIKAKMKNNPIFNKGRCIIFQGALDSKEIYDKFNKVEDLKITLIHSFKNCLISISQSEEILKSFKQKNPDNKDEQSEKQVKLIDGNQSVLEDNREGLLERLTNFLQSDES